MKHSTNQQTFIKLRKEFPEFIFEKYSISTTCTQLKIVFEFKISDRYIFHPELIFPLKSDEIFNRISETDLRNLVFQLGMIELISYWKCTCSPVIIIKPHHLNEEQIAWWKKLYFKGLGEFFHLNGIVTDMDSFVKISSVSDDILPLQQFDMDDKTLVPVGGGKDSIVSLELLKSSGEGITPLVMNMNPAQERTIKNAGFNKNEVIEIFRTIDPQLIKLNSLGFLNGHTPFSALLAFTTLLAAVVYRHKNIALSNESSANESTVSNSFVNHQYSKSFEFESDFREYVSKYISPDLNYFSFLRPLNELQIAALFSQFPSYFPHFRSCNAGSKTDKWCGSCPKCLFTYIILSPFLNEDDLFSIFSKNLLNDLKLKPVFDQLIGLGESKPFECVGTIDDVNAALVLTLEKNKNPGTAALLDYYKKLKVKTNDKAPVTDYLLKEINPENFLPSNLISFIKSRLK